MFDLRYHAVSLVAVFVALLIGLLLGIAIGDKALLSSAEKRVRSSLRADLRESRDREAELQRDLADRARFEEAAYPTLVANRLAGRRIVLVGLGGLSDSAERYVKSSLEGTGGELTAVLVVREPLDLADIAGRATGTRYETLADDPSLIEAFGRRMGEQIVLGGELVKRVRRPLLRAVSGQLDAAEGVVLMRQPPDLKADQRRQVTSFENGFVDGLKTVDTPVVGIETTSTDPSQVGWYRGEGLASVDNVNQVAGRTALVFALQTGAEGAFGTKPSADAILPDVPDQRR